MRSLALMKKQTALVLIVIAILLIAAGVYARGHGGGVLRKWISLHQSNAGH